MSVSSGSGAGDGIGRPLIPTINEQVQTAATQVNLLALGITHDSLQKTFTEVSPRFVFGYLGGFGYRASAENPILDHPLESTRVLTTADPLVDTSWETTYNDLLGMLPSDQQEAYQYELSLPLNQRSEAFIAIDSVLRGAAQLMAQLDTIPDTFSTDSLQGVRTVLNQLLPIAALKGSLDYGLELLVAAQSYLLSEGANLPGFDGYVDTLKQLETAVGLLQNVDTSLATTTDGQLSSDAIASANQAAILLAALSSQLSRTGSGTDLQITASLAETLSIVALALALPNTSSSPLFIALALATLGIYTSGSDTGIIGSNIQSLVDSLANGSTASGDAFLTALLAATITITVGLSSLAVELGIGSYVIPADADAATIRSLALQAAIQLIAASGIATNFFTEAAAVSGTDSTAQTQYAQFLTAVVLIIIDLAAASQTGQPASTFMEWQTTYLATGLNAAQTLNLTTDDTQAAQAQVAIETALAALENNDWTGFNSAIESLFENLGISPDALPTEFNTISDAATTVQSAIASGNPDQQNTGIINVV